MALRLLVQELKTLEEARSRRLFHGTSTAFLDSISRSGLSGDPTRRLHTDSQTARSGYVYLTPDVALARDYAGKAAREFKGDELVLVFDLDPDDPRLETDEDWMATVRGRFAEERLVAYEGDLRSDLSLAWALATNQVGDFKGEYGITFDPGSREHLRALLDAATAMGLRSLGEALKFLARRVKDPSPFAKGIAADVPEDLLAQQIAQTTGEIRRRLTEYLHRLAPHPFVDEHRILLFVLDPFMLKFAEDPGSVGKTKAAAWEKVGKRLQADWPEWFSPESAIISQNTGHSRAVAVKAASLRPDEGYVLGSEIRRISSYEELVQKGEQVIP